jgi:hypothetical protein
MHRVKRWSAGAPSNSQRSSKFFGVPAAPTDVEALIRRARAQHPDFAAWYLALKEKISALEQ